MKLLMATHQPVLITHTVAAAENATIALNENFSLFQFRMSEHKDVWDNPVWHVDFYGVPCLEGELLTTIKGFASGIHFMTRHPELYVSTPETEDTSANPRQHPSP